MLTVIRPRVIRTWVGQLAVGEPLSEAVLVASLDIAVAVALVPPSEELEADGAARACWDPAAISNPAVSRPADRDSAERHDTGLAVII